MPPVRRSGSTPSDTVRLRTLLAGLIAGALVPLAVLSAIVIARVAEDERAAVERRLIEGSRGIADALDREATRRSAR